MIVHTEDPPNPLIKTEYLKVISNYKLKDFICIKKPRELKNSDAPLICEIRDFQLHQILRLYNGFYYKTGKYKKEELERNPSKYIKVENKIFELWCSKEELEITQTGNLTFGDWWTLDVEPSHRNKYGCEFNKKNFERELKDAKDHVKKRGGKKAHLSHPKITWY